jgi:hypothetical protein
LPLNDWSGPGVAVLRISGAARRPRGLDGSLAEPVERE